MTSRSTGKTIWLISKYASVPKYGGPPRLFYLAREFQRAGNRTFLVTSDANHLAAFPPTSQRYNYEMLDGVEVCWIHTRKYRKTASISRVLSWLDFERGLFGLPRKKRPRPDVVIISSLSLFSIVYGYFLKLVTRARLVFEVRDIWPLTMVAEGGFKRSHPLVLLMGFLERLGYHKADLVVGTMPGLHLHVRETIGRDRPFHCSPLGYVQEWAVEEVALTPDVIARYFPKGKLIVGYAGSMGVSNALDPLMESIERLSDRSDIHFVLVGDGDLREAFMRRLKGRSNVAFMPAIPQNQVASFLRQCDVLYLSAHDSPVWRYGQSLNKLIHYMLAGKPVIASFSGYRSMLDEADAGKFVDAGDAQDLTNAILELGAQPAQEREAIGQRGRDWLLANRSYSVLAERYLKAIEALP